MAKTFEKVLTDAQFGAYEESWEIDDRSLLGYDGPPWSITKFMLCGGKQHGVDMVELDNGEMTISIVPTRGMNVLEASCDDAALGFESPVREVVHPAYINNVARGGLGWLEGFSELVCRCGLEYNGVPGEDVIIDNTGAEAMVPLTLHGTISNTPASRVWVTVETSSPYRLSVWGDVYDTRMFGPSYMLRTQICTVPGAAEFTVSDEVRNVGGQTAELELLYHCNFGPPLLGKGSRMVAPVKKLSAVNAAALAMVDKWDTYAAPKAGFAEECYFMTLHGDRRGKSAVALVNPGVDLAASIRFSVKELPYLTLWKHTGAVADGYVTGLEPGTDLPNSRGFEREKGRVVRLPAGKSHRAAITIGLVTGKTKVKALQSEIDALAKGKKSEMCTQVDPDLSSH